MADFIAKFQTLFASLTALIAAIIAFISANRVSNKSYQTSLEVAKLNRASDLKREENSRQRAALSVAYRGVNDLIGLKMIMQSRIDILGLMKLSFGRDMRDFNIIDELHRKLWSTVFEQDMNNAGDFIFRLSNSDLSLLGAESQIRIIEVFTHIEAYSFNIKMLNLAQVTGNRKNFTKEEWTNIEWLARDCIPKIEVAKNVLQAESNYLTEKYTDSKAEIDKLVRKELQDF